MKKINPITQVIGKEFSPLIIRRYSVPELMFVSIITDDNLDNLDNVVRKFQKKFPMENSIQSIRNHAGGLTDYLYKQYKKVEGVAVIVQADKMTVSSLKGDFMNHMSCRLELYELLNFATQV